jgi:hypothetical protein
MVSFGSERPVELSVLVACIVVYQGALNLLHVNDLMHIDSRLVDDFIKTGFFFTIELSVEIQKLKDLSPILITLQEVVGLMIRANQDHTQVVALKASVAVKHILLTAAWHTKWSPRLTRIHLRHRPHIVKQNVDIYIPMIRESQ